MIWISFCRFYACICDFALMAKRVEMLLICSSYFFLYYYEPIFLLLL